MSVPSICRDHPRACIAGIRSDDSTPISEAEQDGKACRAAKPLQRAQHQSGQDLGPRRRVEFVHKWDVDEVEEVKQPNPDNTGDEMSPPDDDQKVSQEIGREVDLVQVQAPVQQ